jgi:catechol 2,3-dioxygenase-like lactoylglutathione lyase family enzyme
VRLGPDPEAHRVTGYGRAVLHHVTLWVPDLARATPPWAWLLGELGYRRDDGVGDDHVLLFRREGFALVLEESPDMVPGMLHSRLRPGLNHLAFALADAADLPRLADAAGEHGWTALPSDRHPIAGGAEVLYLEDRDGFEVELVAPLQGRDAGG